MKDYELTIISKPDDKSVAAVTAKIKGWIEAAKGKVEKTTGLGKKTLAYPIKKLSEGEYTFITFSCDPKSLATTENRLRLEPEIIRYLLVLK